MSNKLRSFIRTVIKEHDSNLPPGFKETDTPDIEVQDYEFHNDSIIIYTKSHEPVTVQEYDIMEFLQKDGRLKNILQDYLDKNSTLVQPKEKSE